MESAISLTLRGQDDKKIQIKGDQREYISFSPIHIPSQEYRNWKAAIRVFSKHQKSNVFMNYTIPDIAYAVS